MDVNNSFTDSGQYPFLFAKKIVKVVVIIVVNIIGLYPSYLLCITFPQVFASWKNMDLFFDMLNRLDQTLDFKGNRLKSDLSSTYRPG